MNDNKNIYFIYWGEKQISITGTRMTYMENSNIIFNDSEVVAIIPVAYLVIKQE